MSVTKGDWLEAALLMINSFGGFEAALFLSGETRDPRKDAPIALLIALATATLLYVACHILSFIRCQLQPVRLSLSLMPPNIF